MEPPMAKLNQIKPMIAPTFGPWNMSVAEGICYDAGSYDKPSMENELGFLHLNLNPTVPDQLESTNQD